MAAPEQGPSELQGSYGWTDTLKSVFYGPGSVTTALPKLLQLLGAKKAFIVTGRSLHTKTDVVRTVENVLKQQDAYGGTFWETGEHAPVAGIRNGLKAFNDAGADIIVSVGGGSPIDASKAILYLIQQETGGPYLPHIAIPTTLSAAEYTIGAGFTDEDGNKVGVAAHELAPAGVILDASLTLSTPERLWLSTGIRALDHAVETLYRPLVALPVKVLCYRAIADLFTYLPQSKADPQSVEIRQKLQLASWMSLWPMKLETYTPLGLSHALGHKLGAKYGIPHGITSCLTLAPTVALQARIASPEDKVNLADALFYLRQPSTGSTVGDVHELSRSIAKLVADLGLRSDLAGYNVPVEDLPKIAELTLGSTDEPAFGAILLLLQGVYAAGNGRPNQGKM
jgi:alcohol dehydrogenase class IV